MGPKSVNNNLNDETAVLWRTYWPKDNIVVKMTKTVSKSFRFQIGDRVRLTHLRNRFSREYDERWMGDIFCKSAFLSGFYVAVSKKNVKAGDLWNVEKIIKT